MIRFAQVQPSVGQAALILQLVANAFFRAMSVQRRIKLAIGPVEGTERIEQAAAQGQVVLTTTAHQFLQERDPGRPGTSLLDQVEAFRNEGSSFAPRLRQTRTELHGPAHILPLCAENVTILFVDFAHLLPPEVEIVGDALSELSSSYHYPSYAQFEWRSA